MSNILHLDKINYDCLCLSKVAAPVIFLFYFTPLDSFYSSSLSCVRALRNSVWNGTRRVELYSDNVSTCTLITHRLVL